MSFAIPGKPFLSLTEAAVQHVKSRGNVACVRIDVKKGGCAGMESSMEFTDELQPSDERVEQDGISLAVAPKATLFLIGTEIDYRSGLLESGLRVPQSECLGKLRLWRIGEIHHSRCLIF